MNKKFKRSIITLMAAVGLGSLALSSASINQGQVVEAKSKVPNRNLSKAIKVKYHFNTKAMHVKKDGSLLRVNFKYRKNLTVKDLQNFFKKYSYLSDSKGKKLRSYVSHSYIYTVNVKTWENPVSYPTKSTTSLKPGQHITFQLELNQKYLKPNTWYSWEQELSIDDALTSKVKKSLLNRLSQKKIRDDWYSVGYKTDKKGKLPYFKYKKGINAFNAQPSPDIIFTATKGNSGVNIPKSKKKATKKAKHSKKHVKKSARKRK